MPETTKKPALRFAGFSDEWEERKLGDIGSTYTGLSGKTSSDFGHGEAKYITYMNVFSNPITSPKMVEAVEIDDKQHTVQKGDVFFTTSSETPEEVGMSSVLQENSAKTYLNSFCFGYRPAVKFDNNFLAYTLRSPKIRKKIVFLAQGISRYNISKNKVMEIKIPIPYLNEQWKIGEHFAILNRLIALHERKYSKLMNVKKFMLEKMFPKDGAKVPALRFAGFSDEWEERKINDVANFSKGNGYSKGDLKGSGTPIILYGRLYTKYQFEIEGVDTFADIRSGAVFSKGNEVIVPASGETAEDIARAAAILKSGILLGGDLNILHPFTFMNPSFVALVISNGPPQKELARKAQGKSIVHIHNSDIQEVTVRYPDRAEQDKISRTFSKLDHLIALHRQELERLQNVKKSCLEKMFA
ncbi:restriction endonuclease subunit S [Jonquetella sp. BV3C21]|uniref:restriction endonuclease subunit S n=1 Tax=Jonquetella sp. BV3C21 TaxID=1111126 RepID=UPI0003ADBEDE|nr:restriction endonuclease subunit S [Jonquetella sp. BV3C21]ERL24724.1 type I restriction modification DNA specificity domain protein [Jonquetella sp. BV3C21]